MFSVGFCQQLAVMSTPACQMHKSELFCSCQNFKEFLAWNWRKIQSLSDCNWTRTHKNLVVKGTLCSYLNAKEFLVQNSHRIRSSNDCNWTWTQNHLVFKWTWNHLANFAKWLSCVVSTYLFGVFDFMFLSSIKTWKTL